MTPALTLMINISAYDGRRYVEISYHDLDAENFDELGIAPIAPAPQTNAQVRKLDTDQSPDAYRGNLGD